MNRYPPAAAPPQPDTGPNHPGQADRRAIRVLHVDTGREWRGGQTQLLHLVRGDPAAAVALPPDAPLRPALESAGILTFPVPFRGRWLGTGALREAARRFEADVVAAHTSHAHDHALAVELPVVVHRRLDFPPGPLSRRKYRRADGFVAVSRAVADVLAAAGVARGRIAVVPDAVDPAPIDLAVGDPDGLRRSLGWPPGCPVVLAVGALVPHKGHAALIDAVGRLPEVRLLLCGVGPLGRALGHRARPLGARVRFLGHRDDVPALLRSVDILAHPSTEEGLGQVVVEAMLAGCPVVAGAVGGLPETIGPLGRLVAPGDPDALADALRRALADGDRLRAGLAAAADLLRARHAVDRLVADTHLAYRRFLGGSARRAFG